MSLQFVVGNVIKQRAPFKSLMLTNMKQCVSNVGLRNTNRLCRSETTNFYATHAHDKRLSLDFSSESDLLTNTFRCYSLDSPEFDKERGSVSRSETEKNNQGPVRMIITEEGKLQVHIVNDVVNNNNNGLEKSVESRLIEFIDNNQIECAIEFLHKTVELGKPPHPNVAIFLLEKLGKDGSVETILHLQHFILDKKLCSEIYFLRSLTSAYHESGKIKDAIHYLKTLCENNQDYSKVQNIFIFLTTMILKKFPQFQSDIVSIVNEYKVSRFPELERELWKCFILSENFKEAENYVEETENLKEYLPFLVSNLNSIIRNIDLYTDEEKVWKYLLVSGENLGLKNGFLLVIYEDYLISLAKKQKFREVILNLNKAKKNRIKIHKKKFDFLSRLLKKSQLTETETKMLDELIVWYRTP